MAITRYNQNCGPRRLGKPEINNMRYLTSNEVLITGLTSRCLLFIDGDSHINIFAPTEKGQNAWEKVSDSWLAVQKVKEILEQFWKKGMRK